MIKITSAPTKIKNFTDAPFDSSKVVWRGKTWYKATAGSAAGAFSFRDKKLDLSVLNKTFDNLTPQNGEVVKFKNDKSEIIIIKSSGIKKNKSVTPPQPKIKSESEENKENKIVKSRGRPRSNFKSIEFPKTPFLVKDLAEKLKVAPYIISNEMNRLIKLGIKFEVIKKIPQASGRGRASSVYKMVTMTKENKENKIKVIKVKSKEVKKFKKFQKRVLAKKKK
jgi:hypothetical protein